MINVTAAAAPGYALPDGAKTEWTLRFTNKDCKVTICHRTAAENNPYVRITVDQDAVDGDLANDNGQGDHYLEHTGPVYPLRGEDGKWGDIIPAIENLHSGLNWDAAGQAIYNNDCQLPPTVVQESTAHYDISPCLVNTASTDVIHVTVTNTADLSHDSVTYTISLGASTTQTVTVADGASRTVTFNNLTAGTYELTINASDGTVFDPASITINQCTVPANPGGSNVLGTSTQIIAKPATPVASQPQVLPASLPATGGETNYTIVGLVLSVAVYFLMLRRYQQA